MRGPISTTRRGLVAGALGGAAAAALPAAAAPEPTTPATFTAAAVEGPYYFDAGAVRVEIAEGHTGVPLEIVFIVRDQTGVAFEGARVDVWHCDAQGHYSGYAGQGDDRKLDTRGEKFLRGTQFSGADGRVRFASIYPGWYPGRTAHIHFKVIDGKTTRLTSQVFLPDALSEYLYANLAAYRREKLRDTLNATDGIALEAGETTHGEVRETARGYVASLEVTVDRRAVRSAEMPGGFPPGALPPGAPRQGGPPPGGPPQGGAPPFGFLAGPPPFRAAPEGEERVKALVPKAG
jgi:protocatechuate 3,4-dioxygenase beta subunit